LKAIFSGFKGVDKVGKTESNLILINAIHLNFLIYVRGVKILKFMRNMEWKNGKNVPLIHGCRSLIIYRVILKLRSFT
jgi:hypothetical protein